MDISNDLKILIDEAKMEIEINKHGFLTRPTRYKILKSFGEIKKVKSNIGEAITTTGRRRRAELSFLLLEKYKYFWNEDLPNDIFPDRLIELLRKYLNGKCSFSELEKNFDYNGFQTLCYNYGSKGLIKAEAFGYALRKTFSKIVVDYFDDIMDMDEYYNIDDIDMDIEQWDYEYMLSIMYSGHYSEVGSEMKRREFWLWYLEEAVPKAYLTYEENGSK